MSASLLMSLLLISSPVNPAPQADDPSPAEVEWDALQESIAPKILRFREASEEDRAAMNFQKEMAAIGAFVRKYAETEPDFASAARVFLARELLASVLHQEREAVQVLRNVTVQAQSPLVAGLAAVHGAEILLRLGDEVGITELRELYVARSEHDEQFAGMLQDLLTKAQLAPGKMFPELELEDLTSAPRKVSSFRGRVLLLFVFTSEHPASRAFLQTAAAVSRKRQAEGLEVLGISLDANLERLRKVLEEDAVDFLTCRDPLSWQSPLIKSLGISSLPTSFLLDPSGRILFVNPPASQLDAFVDSSLDASRQAGFLKDLPERAPGDGDGG